MTEIEAMEQQKAGLQKCIELRTLAQRLYTNRDFKKLILEEFAVNEAARYAQASADPALREAERADALAIAQASGHLRRWLSVQIVRGNQAEDEIRAIDQDLEYLRSGEGQEESV